MPGNGGVSGLRTLSRQGVTSPTNTLGRDDSLALLLEGNPEILPQTPKFVHDMSRLWYKPKISRDEGGNENILSRTRIKIKNTRGVL